MSYTPQRHVERSNSASSSAKTVGYRFSRADSFSDVGAAAKAWLMKQPGQRLVEPGWQWTKTQKQR